VVLSAFAGGLWPGLLSTLIVTVPLKLMFDGHWMSVPGAPPGPSILLFWFPIVLGLMGCIVSVLFEALHRSRRASNAARGELTAILANISAIVTTDVAGRIEYVNKAAAMFLQLDPPDIVSHA
jgi:PAS domain-containing protein